MPVVDTSDVTSFADLVEKRRFQDVAKKIRDKTLQERRSDRLSTQSGRISRSKGSKGSKKRRLGSSRSRSRKSARTGKASTNEAVT